MASTTGTSETAGSSGPGGTDSAMAGEVARPGTAKPSARFPAAGKVTSFGEGRLVFAPAGTNYELHLLCPKYAGPVNKPVRGIIRVRARKVWTVPSGGNWISPIFGTPRTIQGRVRALESGWMVVQAGTPILVDLPDNDIVYDLPNGAIAVGAMVNVVALPGASFEP